MPEVSRRRVLAGVAWGAPVVVLATALPATAASTTPGALALLEADATIAPTSLFASVTVVYAGAMSPSPDAPVSSVRVEITVPATRVTGASPVVSGAGWSFLSRTVSGGTARYTFTWSGADLSAGNPTTTELSVTIAKTNSQSAMNVGFTARGTSLATPVASGLTTVAADIAGTLAFVTSSGNRVVYLTTSNPPGSGGPFPAYRIRGNVRNSGAAASEPITGITVSAAIPATYVTGERFDRTATSVGAGWSLTSPPALSGGVWRLTYTYASALPGATATTGLDFVMKAIAPGVTGVVTLAASGMSDGLPLVISHVGPTSI